MVIFGLSLASYLLPIQAVAGDAYQITLPPEPVDMQWPKYGQAALGVEDYGALMTSTSDQRSVPIASIAKVITAMAVLKQKPITLGEQGQVIKLTRADEMLYDKYLSQNGSVVEVAAGEKITEYQALEAMLLPSANNMADTLAIWAFGSLKSYQTFANNLVASFGMKNTKVDSASGFSAGTLSTASDLVLLGEQAMTNPVLSQIVSKKSAVISVIGKVQNTNFMLGKNGIIGIKTGNTDQAGGCYLFAARQQVDGHGINMIGVILGASDVGKAINASSSIISQGLTKFRERNLLKAGQTVGYYKTAWGLKVDVIAEGGLDDFGWLGNKASASFELQSLKVPAGTNTIVGHISSDGYSAQTVLAKPLMAPSFWWRATRWLRLI